MNLEGKPLGLDIGGGGEAKLLACWRRLPTIVGGHALSIWFTAPWIAQHRFGQGYPFERIKDVCDSVLASLARLGFSIEHVRSSKKASQSRARASNGRITGSDYLSSEVEWNMATIALTVLIAGMASTSSHIQTKDNGEVGHAGSLLEAVCMNNLDGEDIVIPVCGAECIIRIQDGVVAMVSSEIGSRRFDVVEQRLVHVSQWHLLIRVSASNYIGFRLQFHWT